MESHWPAKRAMKHPTTSLSRGWLWCSTIPFSRHNKEKEMYGCNIWLSQYKQVLGLLIPWDIILGNPISYLYTDFFFLSRHFFFIHSSHGACLSSIVLPFQANSWRRCILFIHWTNSGSSPRLQLHCVASIDSSQHCNPFNRHSYFLHQRILKKIEICLQQGRLMGVLF